ncbi:MAG: aminodeoxychorismate synthase component I [Hyphomicrobiales bacterium]
MQHVAMRTGEPLWREIPYADPVLLVRRLRDRRHLTFLDSSLSHERLGRYSYVCCDPALTVSHNPLRSLNALLAGHGLRRVEHLPPFQGGFAGLIAYEFGRLLEPTLLTRSPEPTIPIAQVHLYDKVISFDHVQRRAFLVTTGYPETDEPARIARATAQLRELETLLGRREPKTGGEHCLKGWESNFTRPEYEAAVARTVDYILAGDIFQANIAQRFSAPITAGFDAFAFYEILRARNPATFSAYLDYGPIKVASSSPERLLSFDGALAEARPIKGTRRRDFDPGLDAALRADLLASRKDRAENVMIVDLLRNDLSRVCEPGSVEVPVLCGLESYASVHHLVSVVNGRLAGGRPPLDLLWACFPGGSITGAPKVRAMEIIAEIEKVPRNTYCGSIGWVGLDGRMDWNIAIRTVSFHDGIASFHGGGGITARSDPAAEYEETLTKVERILDSFAP